jgi:phage shock protein C
MVAGVCAGFAHYFGLDVSLVRLAWAILSIVPGAIVGGVIAYVLAWLVMPEPAGTGVAEPAPATRLARSAANRKIAGVCGGLGEYFELDPTAIRVVWIVLSILPGAFVGGLLAYTIAWIVMPPPDAGAPLVPSSAPPAAI